MRPLSRRNENEKAATGESGSRFGERSQFWADSGIFRRLRSFFGVVMIMIVVVIMIVVITHAGSQ